MTFTVRIESACGRPAYVQTGASANSVLALLQVHLARASRKAHVVTITPEQDR